MQEPDEQQGRGAQKAQGAAREGQRPRQARRESTAKATPQAVFRKPQRKNGKLKKQKLRLKKKKRRLKEKLQEEEAEAQAEEEGSKAEEAEEEAEAQAGEEAEAQAEEEEGQHSPGDRGRRPLTHPPHPPTPARIEKQWQRRPVITEVPTDAERAAASRLAQFPKGSHAKTVEGRIGVVMKHVCGEDFQSGVSASGG